MNNKIEKNSYRFIADVKKILEEARKVSYQAVNTAMVQAYWLIGKRIVEEEQAGKERADYGKYILKTLSKELTQEFGKGFSYANLRNFRQFYLVYAKDPKCYTLCSKLTWSHNRLVMRVEDSDARRYYLKEAYEQKWSVRTLERNINTFYYQRVLANNDTGIVHTKNDQQQLRDFIKDPYVFEFLNLEQPKKFNESDIESALISYLEKFLMELGKGFSFVGRQYRISTETDHFYIDLVFYNYLLKCFVLIDLKTGKLQHQDIGQMDMYRRMFDDLVKPEEDNSTVGILLCSDKSETVVKYSVLNDNHQLFAAKYLPYMPTEEELIAEIERNKLMLERGE
ncbi:DUF1016 domain-containing protein [Puteibacter caeruleilacunae]|nr:DUF1016 domain-containing protein [Puteibacter caeruleilacunae]